MRYETAGAFRMALEDRLRRLAASGGSALQRLRKRVAAERFLARLQARVDSPWILKGAFALYLRFGDRSRVTQDLDLGLNLAVLGRTPASPAEVAHALRDAGDRGLDDFFAFKIQGPGESILQDGRGQAYRFGVEARLDERTFEQFRLDVGLMEALFSPPDVVVGGDILAFAEVPVVHFRAISLAQQFAEKLHAMIFPWEDRENTRVKDLVDLVMILELNPPDPAALRASVQAVFRFRGTHPVPATIMNPPDFWGPVYARAAAELRLRHAEVGDAVVFLRDFWAKVFP